MIVRWLQIYILQGTERGKGGPVLAAKIGSTGLILAAKMVSSRGLILAKFSAKIGPARPILGGLILAWHSNWFKVGSYQSSGKWSFLAVTKLCMALCYNHDLDKWDV